MHDAAEKTLAPESVVGHPSRSKKTIRATIEQQGLPLHGGDLDWANTVFGGERISWLDVSTGVSPWAWPVPVLPDFVWQSLPGASAELLSAASGYYRCPSYRIAPVPGSQFAISRIPRGLPKGRVALPEFGYQEHHKAWAHNDHSCVFYHDVAHLEQLVDDGEVEYVVLINPNNPTGARVKAETIAGISQALAQKSSHCLLVVDEAFMDPTPDESCVYLGEDNVLVLRSLGKFFGLAGLRLGFVIGSLRWCAIFNEETSPWLISHPAMYIGAKALADTHWVTLQQQRINDSARKMCKFLSVRYTAVSSAGLFVTVFEQQELLLDDFIRYGQQGVLSRFVEGTNNQAMLRFGLAGDQYQTFTARLEALGDAS